MLNFISHISLILSTILSFSLICIHFNAKIKDKKILYYFYILNFILISISIGGLLCNYLISNFKLINIFENSNSLLPFWYKFSGIWSNHEGSILFWAWVYNLCSFFLIKQTWRYYVLLTPTYQLLNLFQTIFNSFILVSSNPFLEVELIFNQGANLNPLLQDPLLIIHPPLLYFGYIISFIVFALSYSSVVLKTKKPLYSNYLKFWIILGWFCLTLGIILGSYWAYYELGWGGWWYWDPIENISLISWLFYTLLIHSIYFCKKFNFNYYYVHLLAFWNININFLNILFVRSGLLNSVHTFSLDLNKSFFLSSLYILFCLIYYFFYFFKLKNKKSYFKINSTKIYFLLFFSLIGSLISFLIIIIYLPPFLKIFNLNSLIFEFNLLQILLGPILFLILSIFFVYICNFFFKLKTRLFIYYLCFLISFNLLLLFFSFSLNLIVYFLIYNFTFILFYYCILNKKKVSFYFIHSSIFFVFLASFLTTYNNFELAYITSIFNEIKVPGLKENYIFLRDIYKTLNNNYNSFISEFIYYNLLNTTDYFNFFAEKKIYLNNNSNISKTTIISTFLMDLHFNLLKEINLNIWLVKIIFIPYALILWLSFILLLLGGFLALLNKYFILNKLKKVKFLL